MAKRRFSSVYVGGDEPEFAGDLRNAELSGTFSRLTFDGLDLTGATLSGTFEEVSFVGARLERAELIGTFIECNFTNAVLQRCKTRGTIGGKIKDGSFYNTPFEGADLSGADFCGGKFDHARFNNANFASVIFGTERNGVSLKSADLVGARNLTDTQLRAASRLRCSQMPNRQRYQGEFQLYGDIDDARKDGVSISNDAAMTHFYKKCS